jgi:hypothetical protein
LSKSKKSLFLFTPISIVVVFGAPKYRETILSKHSPLTQTDVRQLCLICRTDKTLGFFYVSFGAFPSTFRITVSCAEHSIAHFLTSCDCGEKVDEIYSKLIARSIWSTFLKLSPYTLAGFDFTTHSSGLLGGRRRKYH